MAKDARRFSEWERSNCPEWARGQRQRQNICFHDLHPGWRDLTDKVSEPPGPHGIDLDSDDVDGSAGKREGDRAGAGADLDDKLTTTKRSVGD